MPSVSANGIDVFYERFGSPDDPTLLLVSGLGMQSVGFDDELCGALASMNLDVIRYDNRDVGLSSHLSDVEVGDVQTMAMTVLGGGSVPMPYTLSDMARDGMSLLAELDVQGAHVVGTSMGGMIAQTMAIEHPETVLSLTSVMSNTGEPEYGAPDPDCLVGLVGILSPADSRAERVRLGVELQRLIGTQSQWDEARTRERVEVMVDRSYDPDGTSRQFLAVLGSGSRAAGLRELDVPTMVLHGDRDRLVHMSGGERTADLVPGAELRVMDDMGHDLPPAYWESAMAAIADVMARVR